MHKKVCFRCKTEYPISSFVKNSNKKDGLDSYCRVCRKERKAEWYSKNREHADAYNRVYYQENPDFRKSRCAYSSAYEKGNRHLPEFKVKKNIREAKRRSAKLCSTPNWLTKDHLAQIEQIYWLAQDLKVVGGQDYHVDHIIPLQGKDVCGLHVPWNLQILPSEINISKSNKLKGTS